MAYINALAKSSTIQPLPKGCPDKAFYEWDTNIHCLKSTDATESVNSLVITFNHTIYFDCLLENIKDIFGFDNFSWANIKELTLNISDYYDYMKLESRPESEYEQLISQAVECFSKYIPNIVCLKINNMTSFEPAVLFGKHIAHLYASNLKNYQSNSSYISANLVFGDKLEFLDIYTNYGNYSIDLKQSINSLKELMLVQPPANFDWRIFNSGKEFSKLEFPNLHTLDIAGGGVISSPCPFSSDECENITKVSNPMLTLDTEKKCSGKVSLPALTSLIVDTDTVYCIQSIFCNAICQWPNVKYLTIKNATRFIECLEESKEFSKQNSEILFTAITQSMPNINKINFDGESRYKACCKLLSRVVEFYADQLEHLTSDIPLQIKVPISSDKLETLELKYGLNENLVVKANLTNLKHLKLLNVPCSFKFSDIDLNNYDGVIRFNCLEILNIELCDTTTSWRTGLDKLVDSLNNAENQLVISCPKLKSVSIGKCPYTSMQNILGFGKTKWTNVQELFIKIGDYDHANVVSNSTNHPIFKSSLEKLAQHIYETLPGITKLKCFDKNNPGTPNYMFARLAQLYAPQITYVNIDKPIDLNSFSLTEGIVRLSLNINNTVPLDPHINGQNLEVLYLTNICAPFNWRWFSTDKSSNVVNLNNLSNLYISYSNKHYDNNLDNSSSVSDKIVLDMNSLENIEIDAKYASKDANYPLCYLNLKSCKQITFSGSVDTLPICASSGAHFNKIKASNISADADKKDQFYQFANSWFGTTEVSTVSSLSLINLGFMLDPKEINWINLKVLVVDSPIEYQSLLEIIPKLKQIITLTLKKVSVKSLSAHIQSHPIPSLSNTIEYIELVDIVDCPKDVARQSVEYLVCALPTLMHILIDYEVDFDEATFVNNCHKTYPHVKNVGYKGKSQIL